jgi:AcrR family transcriptional regulator
MTTTDRASHQGRAYAPAELEQRMRDALAALMAGGVAFRDLSVEQLLRAAGVARSTFYRSFGDKAGLLLALEAGSLKQLYVAQRAWIGKGIAAEREDIRASMRQLLDAYLEHEVVFRAIAETSASVPAVQASYLSGMDDFARAMQRLIELLQTTGRCLHLHPVEASHTLAWMTERTVDLGTPGASAARLDAIADSLADIIWATLFADRTD